jgi:hypothetical protein
MINTLEALSDFLGQQATALLTSRPLFLWHFGKDVDSELRRIDYVCNEYAVDILCDDCDRIEAILLRLDHPRRAPFVLQDINLPFMRQDMLGRYGIPVSSGPKSNGLIGKAGRWDRYNQDNRVMHFQCDYDSDRISSITLMRPDVAP